MTKKVFFTPDRKSVHRFMFQEHYDKSVNDGLFIAHNVFPELIIKCTCLNEDESSASLSDFFDRFKYVNPDGVIELWELRIIKFHNLTEQEADLITPALRKLIKRAWYWYEAYLKWEDGNIENANVAKHN